MRLATSVFVWAAAMAVLCSSGCDSTDKRPRRAPRQFGSPKELADEFVDALFEDPECAYSLFEERYQNVQSPQDFRTMLRAGLPPGDAVTSIKFLGIERWHGSDGTTVFEASYEVLSSDDFQPKCNLGVHVVPAGNNYRVERFTVSTPPDE